MLKQTEDSIQNVLGWKLDNRVKDAVEHTPYKRLQDNKFKISHPETWKNLELCAGTFSCICLHRNEHHDYQRYSVQLGLPFMEVPDEGDIVRKSRSGADAYVNFEDKYVEDIKAWEEKEKTFISEIPYISSFKYSDDQQDEGAQNSPAGTSTNSLTDEPTLPLILPTTAHSSPHTPIDHEDGLHGGNNSLLNDNFNVGGGEYDFQDDLEYVDDLRDDTRLEEMTQKPVVKRKRKRVNKSKNKKVGKIYPLANRYTIDDTHDGRVRHTFLTTY
ncbi:hypothetical protein A4A49_03729 [Nicotiana attenuata]|uniref:Uncharacterized protein n=1 Tax=Nicotiana attenuata TaxID=49451 RepID=A0A314L756_NICAT|nr:hypothetical protein A4A49_03729 [Nicotiana attenuata]